MNRIKHLIKIVLGIKDKTFFTKDYFRHRKYQIGDFTYGKPQVLFEEKDSSLIIGKYCSIATEVTIFLGGNHRHDWVTTYPFTVLPEYFGEENVKEGHPRSNGDVVIGNDVWIGHRATIMSGINIANGAVVATNSVVVKDIGPYEIWGGNPAKLIGKRFDDETIAWLNASEWWNWSDEKVKKHIPVLCAGDLNHFREICSEK